MNPKVDFYFTKEKKWYKKLEQSRKIVLDCGLTEELKWGVPCYLFQKNNIVLIHVFKEYCAVLFFKGAFFKRYEWYTDSINKECSSCASNSVYQRSRNFRLGTRY